MSRPSARCDERIVKTLTFQLLVAVNRIIKPFAERYGRRFDLGLPEWRCMMALAAWPDSSGEDVARRMGMEKMTVSRALRRLQRFGRAHAQADPRNRKRNQWRLTDDGWEIVDIILPDALARDSQAFRAVSAEQRAMITGVLASLARLDGLEGEPAGSSETGGPTPKRPRHA